MKTVKTAGKEATLYHFTGMVAEAGKNMETIVSGGGGGGYSYQGTGGSAPVTISSRTVIHDQFFLVDKNGNERAFQLQGFNIACRKDNKLTVIWGIKKGERNGPYIIVHNFSTHETFYKDVLIGKLFVPNQLLVFGGFVLGIILLWQVIGWYSLIVAVVAFVKINSWFKSQINQFKKDLNFSEFA